MFHLGWAEWLPVLLPGQDVHLSQSPGLIQALQVGTPVPASASKTPHFRYSRQFVPAAASNLHHLWLQASIQPLQPQRLQLPTSGLATPHGDLQTCIARDFSQLAAQSLHRAT